MSAGQIVFTLAAVAGGILVYDVVRPTPEPVYDPRPPLRAAEDFEPERTAEPPVPLEMEGNADLHRRIRILEQRLRDMEEKPRVTADAVRTDEDAPAPPTEVELPPWIDPGPDPERPNFDPETVRRFRVLMEEVERIKEAERSANNVRDQLKRLEVQLTPREEEVVIAATLRFRNRSREVMRESVMQQKTREERQAAMEQVRQAFADEINAAVAPANADRILEGAGRYPGLGGGGRRFLDRGDR
jgi:hypothetical protein